MEKGAVYLECGAVLLEPLSVDLLCVALEDLPFVTPGPAGGRRGLFDGGAKSVSAEAESCEKRDQEERERDGLTGPGRLWTSEFLRWTRR